MAQAAPATAVGDAVPEADGNGADPVAVEAADAEPEADDDADDDAEAEAGDDAEPVA